MNRLSSGGSRKLPALFFALLFVFMLFAAFCTPLLADDFNYSFVWACDNLRLEHVRDIPASMNAHRLFTNGRIFSHSMVQFFLIFNKALFNIVNAAVQCLLALLLYMVFGRFSKRPALCLFASAALVWSFCPVFGQVFLWLDGAVNYSWGVMFLLLFLMPFVFHYIGKPAKQGAVFYILYIIEAFVAGAYSENGSSAALFCAFILLIMIGLRFKKLPLYLLLNFLGGCCGFLYLLSAPCLKKGERGQFSLQIILDLFSSVFSKLKQAVSAIGAGKVILLLAVLLLAVFFLIIIRKKRKLFYSVLIGGLSLCCGGVFLLLALKEASGAASLLSALQLLISSSALNLVALVYLFFLLFFLGLYYRVNKDVLALSALFFVSGSISLLVFVFAAYLPSRSAVYLVFYLSISSVLLLSELYEKGSRRFVKIFLVIILIIFILSFILGFMDILQLKAQSDLRMERINALKGSGSDTELPILKPGTKYSAAYQLIDLEPGSSGWINDMISVYYGLGHVTGVPLN